MNWHEVAVTVSAEGEEAVADLFYDLGCPGVSVEDPELVQSYIESGVWDYHTFGEVAFNGTSVVKGYLPENEDLADKLKRLDQGLRHLLEDFPHWVVQVKGMTLREEDWAMAWKAYYKPVRIGKHLLIKPSWEEAAAEAGDIVLELDPGMAFGTGTHATTTLCLEMLEKIVRPGQRVFDLGTGSGILAIAAAKLGARVEAVDLDKVAVETARENAALNGVSESVKVEWGDLGQVLDGKADLVVANIIADVIIRLLPELKKLLAPSGEFLASGIIDTRADEVEDELRAAGLAIVERAEDAGWILYRARWA